MKNTIILKVFNLTKTAVFSKNSLELSTVAPKAILLNVIYFLVVLDPSLSNHSLSIQWISPKSLSGLKL